jgi:hypothetical protein
MRRAILPCMQSVDLNPIRAGLAKTLEGSDFTSVQDRIEDLKQAKKECADTSAQCAENAVESAPCSEQAVPSVALAEPATIPAPARNAFEAAVEHDARAGWLSPITLQPKRQVVRAKKAERRASNKGVLSLGVGEYLQLLDWTARQVRSDKRGAMPAELVPLVERPQISAELWVECVENFHKWFRSSVGRQRFRAAHVEVLGHTRAISVKSSRRGFA